MRMNLLLSMKDTTSPLALTRVATYRRTWPRAALSTVMLAVCSLTKLPPVATQPLPALNCWLRGAAAHAGVAQRQRLVDAVEAQGVVGAAVADGVAGHRLQANVEVVGRRAGGRAGVGLVVLHVDPGRGGVELGQLGVVGLWHVASSLDVGASAAPGAGLRADQESQPPLNHRLTAA